jgi:hypothetical protein
MAGRLTGTFDGRPVVIDADASGIVVTLAMFRSLFGMRRCAGSLAPVLGLLKYQGIPVRMKVAGLLSVDLLPRPSTLARIFAPSLIQSS